MRVYIKKNTMLENIIAALPNCAFLALLLLVPPFSSGRSLYRQVNKHSNTIEIWIRIVLVLTC